MKDLSLTIENQTINFDFDTSKKLGVASVLANFFRENKGIAVYFQTAIDLSRVEAEYNSSFLEDVL